MTQSIVARHANPAKQQRSQRSLERLVEAAEIVLGRDGWGAFTMNSVAAEAGVSIGGIYRRFASKEQLLRAIKDNVLARADADQKKIADTSKAANLSEALDHYVMKRIDSLRGYSGIMRQIFEGQLNDPVMEERGRRSINHGMRVFRSVLSPFRDEIAHDDPELAIETAFFVMNATFMRRVRTPTSDLGFDHIDWDVLQAELLSMLGVYLSQGRAVKRPVRK
ncbi:MAG TPA: helix-turn-helix domain-containing protein [Hyphomonadaceae bacterium]|nr:helix-turn-helix domain-containing protein [Hyphomonadaceae bacterium]